MNRTIGVAIVFLAGTIASCDNDGNSKTDHSDIGITIIVPADIEDFGAFLATIAVDTVNLPRTLQWRSGQGEILQITLGTEESYGGRFSDDPIAIVIASDGVLISGNHLNDSDYKDYLSEVWEGSKITESEAIPFISARPGVRGTRGFHLLEIINKSGINRCRIA